MSTPLAPAKPQGGGQISAPPKEEAVRAEALPAQRAKRRKLMRQTELVERVKAYDPDADEALLNQAYVYAMKAHGKQFRASGDPYFAHPLEVAAILTDLKLDLATIVTALLHDTIEDTLATYEDIKTNFGEEIADLVDGVTKLSPLEAAFRAHQAGGEFPQADAGHLERHPRAAGQARRPAAQHAHARLHQGSRTSAGASPRRPSTSMRRWPGASACSTCARSWKIWPSPNSIAEARNSIVTRLARLDALQRRADRAHRRPDQAHGSPSSGIEAWVYGRAKRPFSIWRKLQDKKLNFEQLSDIFGFRVIVGSKEDCYRALGIMHTSWQMRARALQGFHLDAQAQRLSQSLHTTVIGPEKQRVEVQIRTQEMHDVAERGVAAHWRYRDHDAQPGEGHGEPRLRMAARDGAICSSAAIRRRSSSSIPASTSIRIRSSASRPRAI